MRLIISIKNISTLILSVELAESRRAGYLGNRHQLPCWEGDELPEAAVVGILCAGMEGHARVMLQEVETVPRSPSVLPGGESTKGDDEVGVSQFWLTRAPGMGSPLALGILKVFFFL